MKEKTMPVFRLTIIAAFIAMFNACVFVNFTDFNKVTLNTVTPKGNAEIFEFKTDEYNTVRIEGHFQIEYHAAYSDIVTLAVQPNVMEYYSVEVISGELIVRATRRINHNTGNIPVLTISAPVLNRLILDGACFFTTHDKITADSFILLSRGVGSSKIEMDVNNLYTDISGTGNFELSGRADFANLRVSGTGELNGLNLQTQETTVDFSGTGAVRINSAENLSINTSGTGIVEYRGNPRVSLNSSGTTRIRQVD